MTELEKTEARRERLRALIDANGTTPTAGVNHIAVISSDLERSVQFYRDVLGMPLLSVDANRDEPRSTHLNIDLGNGVRLSLFDFPGVEQQASTGAGGLMHLAISLPGRRLEGIEASLAKHGIPTQRVGGSLYFHDPDGLQLELTLVD